MASILPVNLAYLAGKNRLGFMDWCIGITLYFVLYVIPRYPDEKRITATCGGRLLNTRQGGPWFDGEFDRGCYRSFEFVGLWMDLFV
jgi:hypothetical protein